VETTLNLSRISNRILYARVCVYVCDKERERETRLISFSVCAYAIGYFLCVEGGTIVAEVTVLFEFAGNSVAVQTLYT